MTDLTGPLIGISFLGGVGGAIALWTPAGWLIPAGRFPGLVVAGVAGPLLSSRTTQR